MASGRLRCLCDISNRGDLAPGAESGVAGGTVFNGGEAMTAELEMVVDAGMGRQEALGVAGRLEPLQLPLSSARWLVRHLDAVVQVRLLLGSGVVRLGPGSWAAGVWCASKSGSS